MLVLDHVTTHYGGITMLRGISLKLEAGEIVCVLGPNGCGKTTLIKTIMGLVKPAEGSIHFLGQRIDTLKPHAIVRLGIAVVPEGRRLFPKMTVLENLRIGAYHEAAEETIRERMEAVFQLFPRLKERAGQLAGTLSGGEQAMLALGRGLMSRPKLLLLDEPSLGLAPVMVERMFEIIKSLQREGTTIFLAEQNAKMTLEIANRGYLLQKGAIVQEGDTKRLLESEIIKRAYLLAS